MKSELIKEYNLGQINELAKNYKFVQVEDLNGKKITTWNSTGVPIVNHLKECIKRLKMDIVPNGYYYFSFTIAKHLCKDNADKYLYLKGKAPAENPLQDNNQMQTNKNDLLSVTSALNYITQIAELKTENNRLTMELKNSKDENALLTAEVEEYEREADEKGLSTGGEKGTMEFLKDQAPTLMALADRFFEQKDKALALEARKLDLGIGIPQKKRVVKKLEYQPGSEEHLKYLRLLFAEDKEEILNSELDKLEISHPDLYLELCTEFNLIEDETNNGE